MENALKFRDKLSRGTVCVGAAITFQDPTVTEALSSLLDFVWIDSEHGPLSIESIQGHVMATKGTDAAPLVRVPWNDQVLIKRVLDVGAAGVIAPMVCTEDDARRLVAACKYPPDGTRGFGPRRPSSFGQSIDPSFCQRANAAIMPIPQIEHIDAVNNIERILAVPGVAAVLLGPFDLAGSMGHPANPGHPDIVKAVDHVIAEARKREIYVGMGVTDEPESARRLIQNGVSWMCIPPDFMLLLKTARHFAVNIRSYRKSD